jgi:hypothetical protein
LSVSLHLAGEKNGQKTGKTSNIVVKNARGTKNSFSMVS